MQEFGQSNSKPVMLIHGGAGPRTDAEESIALWTRVREQLALIANKYWPKVQGGLRAIDAVSQINGELELLPDFNAGKGSFLQMDGQARMSASLMGSEKGKFSGVHLVSRLLQPSLLAKALQERRHTVFGPMGAELLARELGITPEDPVTLDQIDRWRKHFVDQSSVEEKGGTVGAVVLDTKGHLAAATSTGGDVSNPPERMSDSATVAGNFASSFAAVSCTGIGEQIVDDAFAARLETRVRDGKTMVEASQMMLKEAEALKRYYAWIGLDAKGNWAICNLCDDMSVALMTEAHSEPFVPAYPKRSKSGS